ncbi:MAG: DivIVA domain-containing protein [Gemmatimonadaceae bacterium]
MTDDVFRTSPIEIKRWDFGRPTLRGFDPSRVAEFRDHVAELVDQLTRANQELDARAKGLVEQLRAYRERDKALNEALVSAQQLRSDIRDQAQRESQLILREARAEGERVLDVARAEVRKVEAEVAALERARRSFASQIRALLERQLAELEAAESVGPGVLPDAPRGDSRSDARGDGRGDPRGDQAALRRTPAWLDSLVKE